MLRLKVGTAGGGPNSCRNGDVYCVNQEEEAAELLHGCLRIFSLMFSLYFTFSSSKGITVWHE